MSRTYTRQEMYDLVWSKALRLLCADFNVSDVALKKACRKANVPTPPVGYWNKLQAGKKVTQIPLPRRGLGMSDSVPVGSARWECGRRDALDPLPPEPVFDGDESDVRARAVKLVGKVAIPRDFTRASPIVRQLLEEDERRVEEARKNRYYWQTPRYVLPIDRRRLRLANGLLLGIASAGGRAHLSEKDALAFSVVVGDQSVGLSIDKVVNRSRAARGQPAPDPVETIEISIGGWGYNDGKRHLWKDAPDAKLESLATEIVVTVVADAELRHRHHVLDHHKHLVAWRAEEIENRRKAKIEAERKERERQERLARERVERLLGDAAAFRQATDIRAYVAAALAASRPDTDPAAIETWRQWALAQADRIDPVVNQSFVALSADLLGSGPIAEAARSEGQESQE
ncbi:MAG: hypothetical protein QHC89_24890 [Bosea sp. (in: a-proteobacteria)]|nr:hypothetical protein [Bosea sp. (in: a-proteobacteria)]